jgi:DNA repair exonuclease SbcCD nuclease subunit
LRLLYFTDTHIRASNPKYRIDNYYESLKTKLQEIVQLVELFSVDYLLHGGDLFDLPWPPAKAVQMSVDFLEQIKVPVYIVSGNHDLLGQKLSTIENTMLWFLASRGLFRLLSPGDKIYLKQAGFTLQLSGQHYNAGIDKENKINSYCVKKKNCDIAIHIVHGMLLPQPFSPHVPATMIHQVAPLTEADFTLCGHAHLGYPAEEIDGKIFINPGSISRILALEWELVRVPQVVFLDFSGGKVQCQYIPLKSARPGFEVLRFK